MINPNSARLGQNLKSDIVQVTMTIYSFEGFYDI